MRGAHRRRSCKAEQGVASPARFATARGRTTPSTPGGTTPRAAIAAWSREERKQNAGPGPKNVTVERREARRRVAPAPGSRLESESPRAVMHALRMHAASGRLPTLRPPLFSGTANGKKKKRERRRTQKPIVYCAVVPAKAGTQEQGPLDSPVVMGPRFRGDDREGEFTPSC